MATASKSGETTITTPSDREVTMSRVFDAPRRLVWEAHTRPEHLKHWLLGPDGWELVVCDMDLRPGGAYTWTWRKTSGTEMTITGEYREIVPPERLVATEAWGDPWPVTLTTLVLTELDGGRTLMTSTSLAPSREARDAMLRTGMADGANQSYDRLERYLRELAGRDGERA
jgi:uncharacterized protein YndB with AHSA1/START domain